MVQHEIDIFKISVVTVVLTTLIASIVLRLNIVDASHLPLKVGAISSVVGAFWILYDKYLWKIGFFRLFGWLCSTPNLNGRWEGIIDRAGEDNPHAFVVEIKQTYSKLKYYVYTKNGKGESVSTKFIKDEVEGKYKLVSAWKSKTRNMENKHEYDEFHGLSIMDYSEFEGGKYLEDIYFTNRAPRTSGETKVKYIGSDLKGAF